MAIWMPSRVAPEWLTFELWGACLIGLGLYLGATSALSKKFWCSCRAGPEILGPIALVCGALLLLGSIPGDYLLRWLPILNSLGTHDEAAAGIDVQTVNSLATFDAAMATARATGKPVLLDFSPTWCVECKIIDRNDLVNNAVRERMREV